MAIALRAVGAIVHGTTNTAPAYPAGILAGDAVFLGVAWKLETATAPTLTGWTKVVDQAVGAGAAGAGTGAQRVVIYRKDAVAGGETGTVTVTPTGSVNVASACIIAFSKTLATWDITYDWGNDNTAAANISAPSQAQIPQTAGDLLAGFIATTANVNMGSSTFTTTGVTYGAAVEHADAGTTNGNDQRVSWVSRPVTAGAQSAVTTFTSTIAGTLTGGLGFVRLRETASGGTTPVTATRATTWDTLAPVAATRATSWDTQTVVTAQRSSTWNVTTTAPVTATRATTWDTRATITATRASTWATRTPVTASRSTTWDVRTATTSTRATTWDTRASATTARLTGWDTAARIERALATAWDVRTTVTTQRTSSWNVDSSRITVTASRATTWRTRAQATSTRATAWDTRALVNNTRATTWDTRAAAARQAATTWRTLQAMERAADTSWSSLEVVETTRAASWGVDSDAPVIAYVLSVRAPGPAHTATAAPAFTSTAPPTAHTSHPALAAHTVRSSP